MNQQEKTREYPTIIRMTLLKSLGLLALLGLVLTGVSRYLFA